MSNQDIAEFEAQLKKVCEFYREKMTHGTLIGTLDNIKTLYQFEQLDSFKKKVVPAVPAPVKVPEKIRKKLGSPVPVG